MAATQPDSFRTQPPFDSEYPEAESRRQSPQSPTCPTTTADAWTSPAPPLPLSPCSLSALSPCSPYDDAPRRGSFDEDDDDELALEKKRECASRVAAWINQSAVRITAVSFQSYTFPPSTSTSSPSSSTSSSDNSDVLDFDLDVDSDFDLDLDDAEPYVIYSTASAKSTPVIHAPVPRRPHSSAHSHGHSSHGRSSRSRSRGRHHGYKPRMPSPLSLYVIQEEDADISIIGTHLPFLRIGYPASALASAAHHSGFGRGSHFGLRTATVVVAGHGLGLGLASTEAGPPRPAFASGTACTPPPFSLRARSSPLRRLGVSGFGF
ncbi:hypothetical protein MSAN_00564100 [Mycena sanguinolenta]|uniref:Uncharacterized protein n=1 Tax=Mycena sanguinolenta TaxID=230812 RepID=A0A8H6Z9Y2_9AGAR|nr:hypothetical protein MSAN_00564100 [Mycena sanguinolenta]